MAQNLAISSLIDSIRGFNSTQVEYQPHDMKSIESETAQQKNQAYST